MSPGSNDTLQAVLWDMDGTLVDTEPLWIASEHELAERHGASWSEELALGLVGRNLLDSGRFIRDHMRLDMSPEQVVELMLDRVVDGVRSGVEFRPGALDLLAEQRRAGVPAALVTMITCRPSARVACSSIVRIPSTASVSSVWWMEPGSPWPSNSTSLRGGSAMAKLA